MVSFSCSAAGYPPEQFLTGDAGAIVRRFGQSSYCKSTCDRPDKIALLLPTNSKKKRLLGRACNYKFVPVQEVLQEALRDRVRRETQSIEELEKKRLFDLPLHSTGNYKSFAVVSGSLQESHTCCYKPSMPLACLRLPKNHILFSANGLRLSRTGTRHFPEQSPSRSMKRGR